MKMNRLISSRVVIIILVSINITNGLFLSTKMKYPFKRISNTVVIQQMKLKCDEHYNSVKVCAEQSYHGNRLNNSNVGFILDTKTKFCKICNFFEVSEKQNFTNNDTGVNQVLYLLGQNKIPDLYFPLEPENFTWPNVTGQGVDATLQGNTTQVGGRIKGGLFFSGRERILLQGSNRTCFGYLSACSKGLTLTMWIKISGDSSTQYLLRGHNSLTIILHNKRYFFGWLYDFDGTRTASFFVEVENYKGIWYHIGASYSRHVGFSLYLNGVLRNFTPISNLKNSTQESYDYSFSIGDLDQGFTGILDEVKFFYTELDHTDVWLDFSGPEEDEEVDVTKAGAHFACIQTQNKLDKNELVLIDVKHEGLCTSENFTGIFIQHHVTHDHMTHSHVTQNKYKQHVIESGALLSGNTTLTPGGCYWWYIPEQHPEKLNMADALTCFT